MKAFLCREKNCEVRHYDNVFRVISLATFIQSLTLPQAVSFFLHYNVIYCTKALLAREHFKIKDNLLLGFCVYTSGSSFK